MILKKIIFHENLCSAIVAILAIMPNANAANVVPRSQQSANRVSATRPTMAATRMPTMTTSINTSASTVSTTPESQPVTSEQTDPESKPTTDFVEPVTIENKSSQFSSELTTKSASESDTSASALADLVRAQRAALDASDAIAAAGTTTGTASGTGANNCDTMLRKCMTEKCGTNFVKCTLDTDTTFGDKLDTCRRTTNCTGHEYQLLAPEIKADRDFNAKIANYNATIDCGNNYNSCIVAQCGATYSKCLGKGAGDDAIKQCESIAKSCTEYDSGLAMRAMGVFGELRQGAERQIAADEQKLYALREQMRSVCTRLGAMFDERSLDCVYTVNFRAGDDATLYASKKLYAGGTFDCTPNWFGIDITTFRENALRTDREQKSASSAMLGSGLGQAVGALTSGAIDRAVARSTADNALKDAIADCIENGVDERTGKKMTESDCRAKIGGGATPTTNKQDDKKSDEATLKGITGGPKDAVKDDQSDGDGNNELAYNSSTKNLSGYVLDEKNRPIENVTVGVVDSDTEAHTDTNGYFSLSDIEPSTKIEFLHKNYQDQTIKVTNVPLRVILTTDPNKKQSNE